jgi:hypothetical protein
MIVRAVIEADFPELLEMIQLFEKEGCRKYGFAFDDGYVLKNMPYFAPTSLVAVENGKVIGVMAGVVSASPLSGESVYQQVFWYMRKEYRSHSAELLERAEEFIAGTLKVRMIVMCASGDERRQTKDRFFRRKGYKLLETHYIKNIGGNDA